MSTINIKLHVGALHSLFATQKLPHRTDDCRLEQMVSLSIRAVSFSLAIFPDRIIMSTYKVAHAITTAG